MKGIIVFALCFVIVMSFFSYMSNTDFSLFDYIEYVNDNLPNFDEVVPDYDTDYTATLSSWDKFVYIMEFVGNILLTPFRFLKYIGDVIKVVFGGLFDVPFADSEVLGGGGFGGGGGGARP